MRYVLAALPVLAVIAAWVGWTIAAPEVDTVIVLPDHEADAVAGERIFNAGGCVSCHAAPGASEEDRLILAGGLELKSPFGTFVAPNISSNSDVGLGWWTTEQFVLAMTKGISPRGFHYFPSFPYTSYSRMRVEDLMDLKAYLDTLPGSFHIEKPHRLTFPFNIRRGVGIWKKLYFDPAPVMAASSDPLITRGQYLVEGPGHCAECHTPRNLIGGPDTTRWLAGGPNPEGPGKIPNITPHPDALGSWTAEDIAYYLETGFTPEFDSAGGSMTKVIRNLSLLPAEDRAAIAAYLKSIPEVAPEG